MGIENTESVQRAYTYNKSWERVAHASYEEYFKFVETFFLVDGRYPLDAYHGFFIWLSRDEKYQDIDGYSVIDMYEKNVIEGGMTQERFTLWCRDCDMPVPTELHGELTPQGIAFIKWCEEETTQKDEAYEVWAKKYNIDTSEGSVMCFIDKDAQPHYIATDFEDHGMIVG